MKKRPDKPSQKADNLDGEKKENLLKFFAKKVVHGNVVLLLGHDSLLRIPSGEEILEEEELQTLKDCEGSIDRYHEILKQDYCNAPNEDNLKLKKFYADYFDGEEDLMELSDMNPEILRLIESKAFRVILTTTFNPLIEKAMEKVWGGPDKIEVRNFCDESNNELCHMDRVVLKDDIKPTLYYLFGKATNDVSNFGNPKFVVDEEDYIDIIKEWMARPPQSLMTYLSGESEERRILAVGCKFESWLFRFFWRAVLEAKRDSVNYKHLLAISLTSSPDDLKLREIFKLYNLSCMDEVNEFLSKLNDSIRQEQENALIEERRRGGIFLSYCSEDFDRVLNLFYKLVDRGFNVWLDQRKLHYGDEYKSKITEAIGSASVFVPVLSRTISRHKPASDPDNEQDENYHFYRDFEWDAAVRLSENKMHGTRESQSAISIVPFALNDYNPRQNGIPPQIKEKYPQIFEKTIESYNNAKFQEFVKTIENIINGK